MSKRASDVFKSHMGGCNFMTPTPIAFGFIGTQWVYEISEGRGFVGELMVGVSVIDQETGERNKEMSDLVFDKEAAYELVEILKEQEYQ